MTSAETGSPTANRRIGRKRDHSRDVEILEATLDVLAEVGYVGMTMDMVAAQAKAGKATVYRRWSSKPELVLDAIARMKRSQINFDELPDTGTLRGDMLALFKPPSAEDGERRLKIMAGLASMISIDQGFADAVDAATVEPWAEAHLLFLRRAVDRGEIAATVDIGTLSTVIPSMAAYRAVVQRKPFDLPFLASLVDGVVMLAIRNA